MQTERKIAALLILARTAFCAARAATQSITIDEAITYHSFVAGPWSSIYAPFDANNHVLHSILAKLSVRAFGLSEFSVRLPSLLGGLALFAGLFFVLERVTRSTTVRWVALVTLGLHPLLLDMSVAARGYSLSLAFFIWAVYFVLHPRFALAGALLGLAVSANLSTAFPAAALILCALALPQRARALPLMIATAAIVFVPICALPLATASRENFYAGFPNFRDWLENLVYSSIHAGTRAGLFGGKSAEIVRGLPLLLLLLIFSGGNRIVRLLFLVTIAGLVAGHRLAGVQYPIDRAALYVVLLFALLWAVAADAAQHRLLKAIHLSLACLLALQFASQLKFGQFQYWELDKRTRTIARILQARVTAAPAGSVAVSATWFNQPALEFYREYYAIGALAPVVLQTPTPLTGYGYYVLSGDDVEAAAARGLSILYRDAVEPIALASNPN